VLLNAFFLAFREILRNKLRSSLTILGIVIGIASVIGMVMLGEATTAYVTQNITKLGSNLLTLKPGEDRRGPPIIDGTGAKNFTMADLESIRRDTPNLKGASPVASGLMRAVYGNKNHATSVTGADNDYFLVKDWELTSGRTFEDDELSMGQSVCIIGNTIKEMLFDEVEPLGEYVRIKKFSCQVIGVLEPKGSSMFGTDQDDLILVPLKLYQRRVSGNQDISRIMLSSVSGETLEEVKESVTSLMRQRRHIGDGQADDFSIRDMRDTLNTLSSTTHMLTLLLGAVAAISLLVGGIGIMNIMLVSVTERTREVGIRLAIGAMEKEVLLQFLVEAVVLSSIGGFIGVMLGVGIGVGVSLSFDLPIAFNLPIVMIAFIFSTLIGVIFGYFPAQKAAKLNPIDALRHE